jgi:lipid II:glycine glycyltransferase (peptidoglycan interpeptide bridge formation enzyme)
MKLVEVSQADYEKAAADLGVELPIEHTKEWVGYEATVPGRTPWGCFLVKDGDEVVAFASFIDYETHGYHYLRGHHAPAWVAKPTPEQERAALDAIAETVRERDKRIVFVRLAVDADLDCCRPTLSTVPYDTTVIMDLTGGDEEILARMKPRGRRDVRKALREAPVECRDETDLALESFSDYYKVMQDTSQRDGFVPAPESDYLNLVRALGSDHCRVFAARDEDGDVVSWDLDTISGKTAVRYYAASASGKVRRHASDKLLYFSACELGRLGCERFDLMAIGSDFSPSLMGLNEFKGKFSKEVFRVAPDRDFPIKGVFYSALAKARSTLRR